MFDDRPNSDESGFDTDVALSTGELRQLIPALIEALGGEQAPGSAPAVKESATTLAAKPEGSVVVADDPPF